MNFAAQDDAVRATFELILRLEDAGGRLLFEKVEEIPLRLTPEQYRAHARQRFAFQDLLAVVPVSTRPCSFSRQDGQGFLVFETLLATRPRWSRPARLERSSPFPGPRGRARSAKEQSQGLRFRRPAVSRRRPQRVHRRQARWGSSSKRGTRAGWGPAPRRPSSSSSSRGHERERRALPLADVAPIRPTLRPSSSPEAFP